MTSSPDPSICLGCGAEVAADVTNHCAGFSILRHPELTSLSLAHVDCDAFFASVEKRDNPELRHKPVVVGGGDRGVVAAACYIARSYGIHSAMPSFKARKLCPDLVAVKPRFERYREASIQVRAAMDALTPLVQQVSVDEAYLDLSGTERLHGRSPASSLIRLQRTIEETVGVTVSVGLSHNKSLAKMASELHKPRGFGVIGEEETLRFLASKPVSSVHGVGKNFAKKLEAVGLRTLGDVQMTDRRRLIDLFGEAGLILHQRARGEDKRPVQVARQTKSISGETTFSQDITDRAGLEDKLYAMCRKVALRAQEKGYAGHVVTLKLKTKAFRTLTRRRTLGIATNLTDVLFEVGSSLLAQELASKPSAAYRLLGIGISDLITADAVEKDLAYPATYQRMKNKEDALQALRGRYGEGVIGTMRDRRIAKK